MSAKNNKLNLPEPPAGLFDRIISAIQQEKELKRTQKIFIGFLTLLLVSLVSFPLAVNFFVSQIKTSGILYFLQTALNDLGLFFAFFKDFSLAILESVPVVGLIVFAVNLILLIFTARLFLHRKRMLLNYVFHY